MAKYKERYTYNGKTFTAAEAFSRGAQSDSDYGGQLEQLERQIETLTTLMQAMFGFLTTEQQTTVLDFVGYVPEDADE